MKSCKVMGYMVFCGDGDGEFFSDAAAAMRYAAYMAELGYDAVFYNCRLEEGRVVREERVSEQFMRACVTLDL